jgi:hypothetical protein
MLLLAAEGATGADWLEAWATMAAAVLSAAALLTAVLVVRRDQRMRHEDKLDADAAQARLVTLKVTDFVGDVDVGWSGVVYELRNNSPGDITNIEVRAKTKDLSRETNPEILQRLGPSEMREGVVSWPQDNIAWPFPRGVQLPAEGVTSMMVEFNDSVGRWWLRVANREPLRMHTTEDVLDSLPGSLSGLLYQYLKLNRLVGIVTDPFPQLRAKLQDALTRRLDLHDPLPDGHPGNDSVG